MTGPDAARQAAYDVLRAVREDGAYANLALSGVLRERGMAGRDAAFTTELAAGTLRGQGLYDAVLAANLDRALSRVDPAVLDVLRLGCHQLLSTRVPPHAAVGESVDLVRSVVGHRPAGFVNAVLRKVARHDRDEWVARVAPDAADDPVGHAAVAHSHPRWVVEALADALDATGTAASPTAAGRTSRLVDVLAADNEPPAVTLVARPGLATVEELLTAGASRTTLSPYAVRLDAGDPGALLAVREGRAGVQDEGSQLVALALADAALDGPDARWLDLCSGPGGKAALLAGLAGERGAGLVAAELQPHRARLVAGTTRRLRGQGLLGVVTADGTRPAWSTGRFDRVLLDAPCTGLGALRRRPEARWRRDPSDLEVLVALQRRLLHAAMDGVRAGGVVVYATCSPVLAETVGVVAAVLAERDDVHLGDAAATLPRLADAAGPLPGTLQLWPDRHGTDAMFIALLRRDPAAIPAR